MSHHRSYFTHHINKHTTDCMCRTLRILVHILMVPLGVGFALGLMSLLAKVLQ
jgi:hypothetical protein